MSSLSEPPRNSDSPEAESDQSRDSQSRSVRHDPQRRRFSRQITDFETADEVAKYKAWRYGTSGQALVDRVEQRKLFNLLDKYVGRGPLLAVDVPCGYGRIAPLLFELGYELAWGDVAPAMAGMTASQFKSKPSIGAFGADISALPLADSTTDLTLTIRLFHHVDEAERRTKILGELARVSRRWNVVSFYDAASLHKLSKGLAKRLQGRTSKITMISRHQFRREAEAAGLHVRAFCAVARGFHAHTYALLEKSK